MASANAKTMAHHPPKRSSSRNGYHSNSSNIKQENYQQMEICIQRVPVTMKEQEVYKMITDFGKVKNFHKSRSPACSYYFAECLTKNDLDAILRGMANNKSGICVELKKPKPENFRPSNQNNNFPSKNSNQYDFPNGNPQNSNKPSIEAPRNNGLGHNSQMNQNFYMNIEPTIPEVKLGHCRVCKKSTTQICFRCHEFYCSVQCQARDWTTHKLYCFRMPLLYDTNKNVEENSGYPKSIPQKNIKNENIRNENEHPKKVEKMVTKNIPQPPKKAVENNKLSYSDHVRPVSRKPPVTQTEVVNNPERAASPKSGQNVIMTFVEQTDTVFVRSNDKEDHEKYLQIISLVEKSALRSKILTTLPKVGEYVLAHDGNGWFRAAVITNELKDRIFVAYVDIGSCEYKKLNELRELLPECFNLMRYPVPIYLKNLENCKVNEKFNAYMNDLVNSFTQLKITYNPSDVRKGKVVAELWNFETNENVNNKCLEMLKPVPCKDEEQHEKENEVLFCVNDLPKESLPSGENIPVFILDGLLIDIGIITCIPVGAVNELDQLNIELKEYAQKSTEVYKPRENEICVAKYSEDPEVWYRAVCCKVSDDEFPMLFFLDYGNTCSVATANIRKYPKAFTLPCKTNECQISGLEHLIEDNANEKLEAKLRELLPLYTEIVLSKVENIDGENTVVSIPKVIEEITIAGLI